MAYKIVNPEISADYVTTIATGIGLTGEATLNRAGNYYISDDTGDRKKTLAVATNSSDYNAGFINYDVRRGLFSTEQPVMPSDEEAIQMANEFLTSVGLVEANAELQGVKTVETTGIGGPEGYTEWTTMLGVGYKRTINGKLVVGDTLVVEIDEDGICGCMKSWRQVQPYQEVSLKPVAQALQALEAASSRGMYSANSDVDGAAQIIIDQVDICYWMDVPAARQSYCAPVYQLEGRCLDEGGTELGDFTAWCEALGI